MIEEIKPAGQVFDTIWQKAKEKREIPSPRAEWIDTIFEEASPVFGKKILEAGSGTGQISVELSREGAKCTLLDINPSAMEIANDLFAEAGENAEFTLGDLFHLPYPDETFDAVWNAGVLEHFEKDRTASGLKEMCRVCKRGGKVIVLVPSARALIYRLGKWLMQRRGTWRYGYERPIWTLRRASPQGWRCIREYQIGVITQIHFWPFRGKRFLEKSINFLTRNDEKNHFLKAILGGYLLVSIFVSDKD
jgi:ubiquinone/menaquinone biosynthesis C-methylase UbiE